MKNLFKKFLLSALLVSSAFIGINPIKANATELPPVYSEGAVLIDGRTGTVLYSKNEHTQYEPASTTKVMTALVVLENVKLTDKVTIGENPPLVDGSAIGIKKGEVYTVEELMLGLLLESGNDCAEALAEYVSGSNAEFAKLMNAKAKELGALNTNFKNPSGLHEEGHLTTAYDLALIMKAAANNKEFVRLAQTDCYKYVDQPFSDGSEKWATNRNQLFNEYSPYYYTNAYCGKNGYTPEANHTYTAAAVKGDQILIASFLNATDKDNFYTNIGPLFDYGFDNFETVKLISEGEALDTYTINDEITLPLLAKNDFYYTKSKSYETPKFSIQYDKSDISKMNINLGDTLYKAKINIGDETVSTVDLVSGANRVYNDKIEFKENFSDFIKSPMNILYVLIIAFALLLILRIIITSRRRNKRRIVRKSRPRFNRYKSE
ncbi:D-alanyl-D-alanine carboxypeptidase family protein [Clostridium sp. AL.422]|uniref:D-alanyl-D-alanine carboxypeptidase family protein n=1 Tax=Clostridium TaxID=1485 RepID=UPI00293DA302|nr:MULTISPECIES: D-alanyl-D-alanine carboxypeptidase family protein [unclassified Clostridium]MDV4149961.1 D-alanyl-D-alanine carboxypeptidase family protein [Clostridium sp. AL.422]